MDSKELLALAADTIELESRAVASVAAQLDENFIRAAETLLACRGHVLVTGAGTSHSVALRLAHLLTCCGTPALFIDAGDSQHGLAGAVQSSDVLLALSKGGETAEVNFLAEHAHRQGAQVVAITEQPVSSLGKLADVILKVVAPVEADPYGMIATGSSLVNAAAGDALCVALLHLRGVSREQFGATHPGGAVGKKLSAGQGSKTA